jgi:hypothetical protein
MDTGTMFLLSIIAMTAVVTWILGRKPARTLQAEERSLPDIALGRAAEPPFGVPRSDAAMGGD